MTADARMGSDELHRPPFWDLSDTAYRVLTAARQWCAGAENDGRLRQAYLSLLRPGGVPDEVAAELVAAGHWARADDGDGYQVDWSRQSTAAEMVGYRERKRVNQARYRARVAARSTADSVTGHVGKARQGSHLAPVPPPPPLRGGGGGGTGTDARTRADAREDDARPGRAGSPRPTPVTTRPAAAPTAAAPTKAPAATNGAGSPSPRPGPAPTPAESPSAPTRPGAAPPADTPPSPASATASPGTDQPGWARNAERHAPTAKAAICRKVSASHPSRRLRAAPEPERVRRRHPPPDPWHQLPLNLWITAAGEPVPVPPVEQLFPTVYATTG